MSILLPTYFICGIMEVFAGNLRGMGYSLVPMLSSVFGACIVRSWWVIVIFGATESRFWLYISYPVSWLITLFLHMITMVVVKKRQNTLLKKTAIQE
jgi:Na+-driven multidrug efflux pump